MYFVDIETEIIDGFPDAETAPTRVLSISVVYDDKIILLGLKEMPQDMQDRIINNTNKYFEKFNIRNETRTTSGITQITVLTSPRPNGQTFTCEHNCYYCPNEPAHEGNNWTPQPRSYLFGEPAVLRANENKFDMFLAVVPKNDDNKPSSLAVINGNSNFIRRIFTILNINQDIAFVDVYLIILFKCNAGIV